MQFPTILAALLLSMPGQPEAQRIHLEAGDYRYMPLPIRKTPVEVDCQFQSIRAAGNGSVHAELLLRSELHLFLRGKEHQHIVATGEAAGAGFRHLIDEPGDYEVLVQNSAAGPPADLTFEVAINSDPDAAVSTRELTPSRRLAVILVSFGIFFAIVIPSGLRLTRALRQTR